MKDVVRFFWEEFRKAMQMDKLNPEGHNCVEVMVWTNKYKNTLSKNKQRDFDKEWDKLDKSLEEWHTAASNKQKNMPLPLGL